MNKDLIHQITGIFRPCSMPLNILMVDGPARSGKTTISRIAASFDRVEAERIEEIYDYIGILYGFGKMDKEAAVTLLRLETDIFGYNACLARNSNFRWKDSTSIFRYPNWKKYIKRLFESDGDSCVEKMARERPIFQVGTHHQMEFMDLHFDAHGDRLRVVELRRNPIDMIDGWMGREHGKRLCTTARDFSICLPHKNESVYYLGLGWEEDYINDSPIDRIIRIVYVLHKKIRDGYIRLPQEMKEKIYWLCYEDIVANPIEQVENIAKFLGTKTTRYTKKAMKDLGFPRAAPEQRREERLKKIRETASKKYLVYLDEMIEEYRKECSWIKNV